jgi:hypothetical protein
MRQNKETSDENSISTITLHEDSCKVNVNSSFQALLLVEELSSAAESLQLH